MNERSSIYEHWVMRIIIANVIFFILQRLTSVYIAQYSYMYNNEIINSSAEVMTFYFGLTPSIILAKLYAWQLATYMFLHGGFFHLFLNMYALLIFGIPIEQYWGSKKFLLYYLFTGTGAGITIFAINIIMGGPSVHIPTIGASGAVFGLLLAFGILYPNVEILLFFFIPMKAKYLVIMYGAIELYSLISTGGHSNISHVGHLGGLFFGLLFFLFTRKRGIDFKRKIVTAQFKKDMQQKNIPIHAADNDNKLFLQKILDKVKTPGHEDLSDDEFQHLKYLEIMFSDTQNLCDNRDYNKDSDNCKDCDTIESCLLREIKKFIT